MAVRPIEEEIKYALYDIIKKYHHEEGVPYEQAHFDKATELSEIITEVGVDDSAEGQGETTPRPGQGMQLRLKPSLDERILRLLMLMSLGLEPAIKALVKELLHSNNKALTQVIAKAMEKGNYGAELVLRQVTYEADGPAREKILEHVKDVSPSILKQLSSPVPRPRPTPFDI